jgi:hypothetical protein
MDLPERGRLACRYYIGVKALHLHAGPGELSREPEVRK